MDPFYHGEVVRYSSRVLQNIQTKFKPVVQESDKPLIQALRIDSSDFAINTTRAVVVGNERKIYLSLGFFITLVSACSALVDDIIDDELDGRISASALGNYIAYLGNLARETTRNQKGEKVKSFLTWLRTDVVYRKKIEDTFPGRQNAISVITEGAYAAVIAHEVGHHSLGHFKSSAKSTYQKEKEADEFAAKLLLAAGYCPSEAAIPFYLFAVWEGFRSVRLPGDQSKHPPGECRAYWFLKAGEAGQGKACPVYDAKSLLAVSGIASTFSCEDPT